MWISLIERLECLRPSVFWGSNHSSCCLRCHSKARRGLLDCMAGGEGNWLGLGKLARQNKHLMPKPLLTMVWSTLWIEPWRVHGRRKRWVAGVWVNYRITVSCDFNYRRWSSTHRHHKSKASYKGGNVYIINSWLINFKLLISSWRPAANRKRFWLCNASKP